MGNRINAKQAGLALCGLQIAAQKIDDSRRSPRDTVRDIIRSKQGDELAPELCVEEQGWGKSYEDCSEGPHFDACEHEASENNDQEPSEESGEESPIAVSAEDRPSPSSGEGPVLTIEEAEAPNFQQAAQTS
jgi:hypothetical protein